MRSTPTPYETLRTVKLEPWPARRRWITTPSKTWMRSLSPSRTRTCTRTLSPGRNSGSSALASPPSIDSISLMRHLPQHPAILLGLGVAAFRELRFEALEQIRPAFRRQPDRLPAPEPLDLP